MPLPMIASSVISNRFIVGGPLMLDGYMLHMRYAAHVLNLVVQDGLDVIKSSLEKIRDSVHYWTATQGRQEKFEEAASQLKVPCTKKLTLDCKTRWNSTYLMLEVAISYKNVFPRLKQRERLYMSLPSEDEWKLANEVCRRLKLFFQITESFSKTKNPTSNELFPRISEVKLALQTWSKAENEVIKSMAIRMMEKFDKYWSECSLLAVYGADSISQVEKIREACYSLLKDYQDKINEKKDEAGESGTSEVIVESVRERAWADLIGSFVEIVSEVGRVNVKTELDFNLEENVFPRSQEFDILNWWKANGVKYPTLQLIARDILAIPVSTVASELAFSTSGRVVSLHRSRLTHTTIEALMCSQDWLWHELEGDDGTKEKALIGDEETN